MDSISDIIKAVFATIIEILSVPGIAARFSVMVAIAILIGFMLYEQIRGWWKWGMAALVYFLFEEWIRLVVLDSIGIPRSLRPATFGAIALAIYGLGLGIGVLMAHKSRKRRDRASKAVDEVIEGIKDEQCAKRRDRPTLPGDIVKKVAMYGYDLVPNPRKQRERKIQ